MRKVSAHLGLHLQPFPKVRRQEPTGLSTIHFLAVIDYPLHLRYLCQLNHRSRRSCCVRQKHSSVVSGVKWRPVRHCFTPQQPTQTQWANLKFQFWPAEYAESDSSSHQNTMQKWKKIQLSGGISNFYLILYDTKCRIKTDNCPSNQN